MDIKYPITVYGFNHHNENFKIEEVIFTAPEPTQTHEIDNTKFLYYNYGFMYKYYLNKKDAENDLIKALSIKIRLVENNLNDMKRKLNEFIYAKK